MSEGKHYTYTIVLGWSESEQVYCAEVPAIPGCEGSGRTYEAALASVQEAIRWWHERSSEGSSSPVSQMLMEDARDAEPDEEPSQNC
jgi:predicted RNase H-like HicB family nuclease